jgi:hypothetical protein
MALGKPGGNSRRQSEWVKMHRVSCVGALDPQPKAYLRLGQLKVRAANLAEAVPTEEIGSQRLSRYSQLLSTRLEAQSQPELEVATLIKGNTGHTLGTTLLALDEQGNTQPARRLRGSGFGYTGCSG